MAKLSLTTGSIDFDRQSAYYLATAAHLAYLDPDHRSAKKNGARQVKAQLGLTSFRPLDHGGTQGFIASDDDKIVVAFRGTEPTSLIDWLTDLSFWPRHSRVGKVHGGFDRALDDVWDDVLDELRRLRSKPLDLAKVAKKGKKTSIGGKARSARSVWITGHSLGGALATLAASRLAIQHDFPFEGVYTFGQPRVGDREWAAAYNSVAKQVHHRVVNNNDLVTRVPTRSLGFSHAGSLQYIDTDGDIHNDIGWWNGFLDRVRGQMEDFVEVLRGDLVLDGIDDHFMESGYLAKLKAAAGATRS